MKITTNVNWLVNIRKYLVKYDAPPHIIAGIESVIEDLKQERRRLNRLCVDYRKRKRANLTLEIGK